MTVRLITIVFAAVATLGLGGANAAPTAHVAYVYLKTTGYAASVNLSPGGRQVGECDEYCKFEYAIGTPVTLTAQGPRGSSFVGWHSFSDDFATPCSGVNASCSVTVSTTVDVKAVFSPVALRVRSSEGGYVEVKNSVLGCGSECWLYAYGSFASISARERGGQFAGWSGGCRTSPNCKVSMTNDRLLAATFRECSTGGGETFCKIRQPLGTKATFWVKVIGGRLSGSVNCSGSCSKQVRIGQQLSLVADPPQRVQSWYGKYFYCAPGTQRCTFRVASDSTSSSPALVVTFG